MTTLLLVGTTGLVGSAVRAQALNDPRVSQIIALSRQPLAPAERMQNQIVNFEQLTGAEPWWAADAVICTLGTTRAQAGSRQAFRRVDHDYTLAVARHSRAAGALTFVLASAIGAAPDSRLFYNRVKGELERDLRACHFPSLTFVRPALISGQREQPRRIEQLAIAATSRLQRVLPPRWHVQPAQRVATMLIDAALTNRPGIRVIEADQFTDWPDSPFL